MKRILAGILSLCLMISLIPTATFAEAELPNAEVTDLGNITVGADDAADYKTDGYYVYDLIHGGGLSSATEKFGLQIALEFLAKETAEEAATNPYANHITDFFITFDGLSGDSFVGDGCYLAGYYPSFGAWVKIPLDGFTVEKGEIYPVITSAGFNFTYEMICSSVEDFICGIYLSDAVLAANPNLEVTLDLGLSEDADKALAGNYIEVESFTYNLSDITGIVEAVIVRGEEEKAFVSLEAAFAAAKDGDTVYLCDNADIATAIEVTKDVTLDLNSYNITAVNDTAGDGLFHVTNGGCLTIEGEGTLDGKGNNNWNMALWADGGTINIVSGKYTNAGASSDLPNDDHFDLIYAKNGGTINIYGGEFVCVTPRWTLNSNNSSVGTINVYGGAFFEFDPTNANIDDDSVKVAEGYVAVAEEETLGKYYVVKKVEISAEIPEIDETKDEVQTTIDTENAVNEEIATDVVATGAAALEEAIKGDETALKEHLGIEATEELPTELKDAIVNREEITAVFTVDSEPVDLSQPLPAPVQEEILEIKEAMGVAADEEVEILEITVSTVYKKADGTELAKVEHKELAAELTHIVKLPAVPAVEEGMVRIWTMYSYHDGEVKTYPVTDLGDGTGAFASAKYSLYALGYEDVPEVTEHEHNWSKGWKSDETSHRRYCKTCGDTKSKKPHEDLNNDGICDVCEHKTTVSTGRTNPNTGVKF